MMEVYVLVARKKSVGMLIAAGLLLALALASLILSCMSSPIIFAFTIAFSAGFYFVYLYTNQEFEYSYFDGDVRFAKILNKSKRKQLKGYSMDDVTCIAPAGDERVVRFEKDPNVRKKNYTSGKAGVPYYEMVVREAKDNGCTLIQFEPDEEYLNAVCMKYGQKVVRKRINF